MEGDGHDTVRRSWKGMGLEPLDKEGAEEPGQSGFGPELEGLDQVPEDSLVEIGRP